MNKNKLTNPHDKLFKAVFEHPEAARDLIRMGLNKEQLALLDLDTLKPEKDTFINDQMEEYFSDLVYSCQRNDSTKCFISFLLEHKSYASKFPHIQLSEYLIHGYKKQAKKSGIQQLNLILPIVLYHGKEEWIKKSFVDYFNIQKKNFNQYIPNFEYELIDLSNWTDEKIVALETGFAAAALLLMKNRFERDYILQKCPEIFYFFGRSIIEIYMFEVVFRYATAIHDYEPKEIKAMIDNIERQENYSITWEEAGERVKSVLDELRQEAREKAIKEGREEGIQKGREEGIQKGREEGMQKGRKEGIQKGREEGEFITSIQTTLISFSQFPNASLTDLSKISGLDIRMVELLKERVYKIKESEARPFLVKVFENIGSISEDDFNKLLTYALVTKD